jgi:predicted aspartyl protease
MLRKAVMERVLLFLSRTTFLGVAACLCAVCPARGSEVGAGVALSRSTGNHLFAPVRINEKPAWFAVDTGAALTIVDSSKAKALGLQYQGTEVQVPRQIEVNNRVVPVAHVDTLEVGSTNLGSGPVALIDLRDFRGRLRETGNYVAMDGIIGLDIMQRYGAVIDCANQRIYLQTQDDPPRDLLRYVRARHYKSVPLRIARSGALEVETELGNNRYSFVVDTGGFATLVSLRVAAQNGVPVLGTTVNARGIHSKEKPVGLGLTPMLQIGPYRLGPTLVGVTALPEGPEDLRYPFGGLIGADFLFNRHAVIDIKDQRLYFK